MRKAAVPLHEMEVSTTQLATVLRMTPRRVRALAEAKKLPQVAPGRFNLVDAVGAHVERLREVQERVATDFSEAEWRKRRLAA